MKFIFDVIVPAIEFIFDVIVPAIALVLFGMVIAVTIFGRTEQASWSQKCKDAGGIPAITARGPDVCLNPSAVIHGVD